MDDYNKFVSKKLQAIAPSGLSEIGDLPASLFPHQTDLVRWAGLIGLDAEAAREQIVRLRKKLEPLCEARR